MSETGDVDSGADSAEEILADLLREGHRRVRLSSLSSEQKASATRRLLAISDASKRDVHRALSRLQKVLVELPGAPESP